MIPWESTALLKAQGFQSQNSTRSSVLPAIADGPVSALMQKRMVKMIFELYVVTEELRTDSHIL